ncbi:MAG: PrsW family intramembrane metalloprotease [Candidatus Vogelbacteria bacterium]|nr:PrsW family intramembrane metalloprotease [Candidatus Vogelbacteria bacterium]
MAGNLTLILYSLAGGLVPVGVWLWFWLKEDKQKPEPARLVIRVFLAGAASVALAYFFERSACDLAWLAAACQGLSHPDWLALNVQTKTLLLAWAGIEELLKFLAAYLIIFRQAAFDEPVDAMIYMITAALGFAAIENGLFLFNTLTETGPAVFLLTGNLRFMGANIVHVVSSAFVGGMMALAFCFRGVRRFGYIVAGLVTATLLHALFNFLIIISDGDQLFKVLALLWLFAIFIILLFEKVKTVVCPPKYV